MNNKEFPKRIKDPKRFDAQDYEEFEKMINSKKPIVKVSAPNRNDICPCGSGIKYKKCCMEINAAISDKL